MAEISVRFDKKHFVLMQLFFSSYHERKSLSCRHKCLKDKFIFSDLTTYLSFLSEWSTLSRWVKRREFC